MIYVPELIAGWRLDNIHELKSGRNLDFNGIHFISAVLGKGLFLNGRSDYAFFDRMIYFRYRYSLSVLIQLSYNLQNGIQYLMGQNPDRRYYGIRWSPFTKVFSLHLGAGVLNWDPLNEEIIQDKWYHFILNRTGSYSYEIFLDGKSLGTVNNPRLTETMELNTVGRYTPTENMSWYGGIDELYIFNQPLDINNIERIRSGLHPIF